ncbi:Uncharacterised protein [Vibrio cholerae]|nr:Uncharacterised protein [Vibrio cholerae]
MQFGVVVMALVSFAIGQLSLKLQQCRPFFAAR